MIDKLKENERAALAELKCGLVNSQKNSRGTVTFFTSTAALVVQALDRLAPVPKKPEDFIGKVCSSSKISEPFLVFGVSTVRKDHVIGECIKSGYAVLARVDGLEVEYELRTASDSKDGNKEE